MPDSTATIDSARATVMTLMVGAVGATIAFFLSFPIYVLTGPAILVSILSMLGVRTAIANPVRNVAFLFIGIGLGTAITDEALDSFLHWPLAFVVLAILLWIMLVVCRNILTRWFEYDGQSALLAASPGHLSYVLSLGSAFELDLAKISVVQSVRLLALTLIVPVVALWFGMKVTGDILPPGEPMLAWQMGVLLVLSFGVGLTFLKFRVPAALLLGGLLVSGFAHGAGWVTGVLPTICAIPSFVVLGTLIGTRFSNVSPKDLREAAVAGLAVTAVGTVLSVAAAVPVALWLGMPITHVIVAFAPGGLETMVAMGAVLGANPGFVVACHVGRLLLLTVLVPLVLTGGALRQR